MNNEIILTAETEEKSAEFVVDDLIMHLVNHVKSFEHDKKIEIEYDVKHSNQTVFSDQEKVSEVFTSLLKNAIGYATNDSKILIEQDVIKGRRHNDVSDLVRISVRICGTTIHNDILENALLKLQNRGQVLTINRTEDGQELATYKSIMKSLGGNFWLRNKFGKDVAFYISIPFSRAKSEPDDGVIKVLKKTLAGDAKGIG